ncbi:MAG: GNAT family N-acetyltransferase [Planctomycetes bacterium]|nr:GNAT family N-acetyltransferase [Planctomycetota bacterium]
MTHNPPIVVRNLRLRDLDAVIEVDSRNAGRRRTEYFKVKLAQAIADTGIQISLAAERGGVLVGFLLARVYYGEFGSVEKAAVLDTIGVHPDQQGQGAGAALLRQLRHNLLALGIQKLQTQVRWEDPTLLAFFHRSGFRPAARIDLDLDLGAAQLADDRREAARALADT